MTREADETVVGRMVVDELTSGARQAAHLQGPAPDMENVVGQQERDLWNYRDQSFTPEQMAQLYVQARNEGYDHQDALGLVTLKAYPNRGPVLLNVSDDPKEQAAYARKMKGTQPPQHTANGVPSGQEPGAGGY